MELKEWESIYNEIIEDFGFSKEDDLKSALTLSNILKNSKNNISLNYINKLIKDREVYVFGAGPSLKEHVRILKDKINNVENNEDNRTKYLIISADGATKALLEENIVPDIIVSDLDGDLNAIIECNRKGSIVVVHAHGDNVDLIKTYTPKLKNTVGSSQVPKEILNIINYGGFTDGDRCCFFAEHFGAKKIILCGMDFGEYTTKYSRPHLKNDIEKADDIKIKKLQYAKKLINWLKENGNSEIVFVNEL